MSDDSRQIIVDYYDLSTDETTILRHEQLRVREAFYTGTTDADATTNINLVGIPVTADVLSVSAMIRDNTNNLRWRVHGTGEAADSTRAFRLLWDRNTSGDRQVLLAEVGSELQSQPYRVHIRWVEKI